jgi:hypothetical protein
MDAAPSQPRARRPLLWSGSAVVTYVVLACAAFAPTAPFDGTRLPNGPLGDPLQMVWFLAWTPYALLHGHDPFFTTAIDYPSGVNLAANTSVPLLGLLAAPFTLTLGPIAAFNVLLRCALATSAISTYFVLGRWCWSRTARFVGGLVYGFGPYLATHIRTEGHLNLVFLAIPPLLAWCVDAALCRTARSPVRVGMLAGLLAVAQLLISPEVLSDTTLVALVVIVLFALGHRDLARQRVGRAARAGAAAVATFAVLGAWPIVEMLGGRRHLNGPVATVSHLQSFRIDLLEPFLPTDRQLVAPGAAVRAAAAASGPVLRAGGGSELGAYLGIPIVLACLVVIAVRRRDLVVQAFALVTGVAFLLSLGGRLEVNGHLTPIRLPEAVLGHLPLLENTVPARFSALVALGAAVLVALGIDRALAVALGAPRRRRRRAGVAAIAAAIVLVLVPLLPASAFSDEQPAIGPGIATTLERYVPSGAVVLAYPYADPPFTEAMAWQAVDGDRFSMIGGYATVPTAGGAGAIFAPLLDPPTVQEFLAVAEAGRARHYPSAGVPSVGDLCSLVDRYRVGVVLFAPVGPKAADVLALFTQGFGAPEVVAGVKIWRVGRAGACVDR